MWLLTPSILRRVLILLSLLIFIISYSFNSVTGTTDNSLLTVQPFLDWRDVELRVPSEKAAAAAAPEAAEAAKQAAEGGARPASGASAAGSVTSPRAGGAGGVGSPTAGGGSGVQLIETTSGTPARAVTASE